MHRRPCEVRLGLTAAAQRLCLISGKPECAAGILPADPGTFPHSTTKRADVEVGLPTPYGSPQKRRESVGRAVHCAPELLVRTRSFGLKSGAPRSYERGYGRVTIPVEKSPDTLHLP